MEALQQSLGQFVAVISADAQSALFEDLPALAAVDAVMVDWCPEHASVIPRLRKLVQPRRVPIIVLGELTPATRTAALMMQADYVDAIPPSATLLEAILTQRDTTMHSCTNLPDLRRHISSGDSSDASDVPRLPVPELQTERIARPIETGSPNEGIETPRIRFDLAAHECYVDGRPIELPYTSYKLLHLLLEETGKCCTREQILDTVWSEEYIPSSNVIDYRIHELRKLLKPFGLEGCIRTVRRVGYRYCEERGRSGARCGTDS
jgi:DNA-binding response OmpR family regulator